MLCVNAPRKPMARIHLLISLVLVIVCTIVAFTPLMQVVVTEETTDKIHTLMDAALKDADPEIKDAIDEAIDKLDLEGSSISISITDFFTSATAMSESSQEVSDSISAMMGGEKMDEESMESLGTAIKNMFIEENEDGSWDFKPEAKNMIVLLTAVLGDAIPTYEEASSINGDNVDESIGELMSRAIPNIIGLLIAFIVALIIPIIYVVLALITLISGLTKLREPDIGAAKLAKRMPKSIVHPLTVMLVAAITPAIEYTASTMILAVLALVGSFVNLVFTRLHSWERKDIAYANAVQFSTLVSIGAYVFLFLNILKMGVFATVLGNLFGSLSGGSAMENSGADIGMCMLAVLLALLSTRYLAKVLRRESLACTPKRKGGARACYLVYAIVLLLVTILPMMALGSENHVFVASLEQEYALFYGFIATCLMVVSEIVVLILRKVFGKKLSPADVADVLSGVSVGPEGNGKSAGYAADEGASAEDDDAEDADADDDLLADDDE